MANLTVSSSLLKRYSGATGPKVSSLVITISVVASVSTVCSKRLPSRAVRLSRTSNARQVIGLTHSNARHNIAMYVKGALMPVAKVYVPEGTLTPEQRREIIKGIHDVINSVEKRPPDGQTYVLINEVPPGHWGNAGTVYAPS